MDSKSSNRRVTLDEVVKMTLSQNNNISISKLNQRIGHYNSKIAWAIFDPNVSVGVTRGNSSFEKGFLVTSTGTETVLQPSSTKKTSWTYDLGISGATPLGPKYSLGYQLIDTNTDTVLNSVESNTPTYVSLLSTTITFPLLRGGWFVNNLKAVRDAEDNLVSLGHQTSQEKADRVAAVSKAYIAAVTSVYATDLRRQSVESSEKILGFTEARVRAGTLAKVDQATSKVFLNRRKVALITAEKAEKDAYDAMIDQIDLTQAQEIKFDVVPLEIRPFKIDIDQNQLLRDVYSKSPAVQTATIQVLIAERGMDVARLNEWPNLDLSFSYIQTGASVEDSGNSRSNIFGSNSKVDSTIGITLSMPIGNREPYYSLRKSIESHRISELNRQETTQRQLTGLKQAIRSMKLAANRVRLAKLTTKFVEMELSAKNKRFKAGFISAQIVLESQDDLTNAELNIRQSFDDYVRAILDIHQIFGISRTITEFDDPSLSF